MNSKLRCEHYCAREFLFEIDIYHSQLNIRTTIHSTLFYGFTLLPYLWMVSYTKHSMVS